ncbi:MAG: ribonuclease P protein component [Caldisericia bacterium]|jgi:ribonuclease P protein component|nr:ribonuclease P protein component [Caldisericia bacterium]
MGKLAKRLTKKEIDELVKTGIKFKEKNITFIVKKKNELKVAFIPIKTKGSVERNRLRRFIREIFYSYQKFFDKIWVAIIIPPFVIKKRKEEIMNDFEKFLRRYNNEKISSCLN